MEKCNNSKIQHDLKLFFFTHFKLIYFMIILNFLLGFLTLIVLSFCIFALKTSKE